MGACPPSKSYVLCGRSANVNDADPPPSLVYLSSNPKGSDGAHGGLTGVVRCTLTPDTVCFPAGVQMESHPHLGLKRKTVGRHQTYKAALTGKYGGNVKRDAVLTGEYAVNVVKYFSIE